MVRWYKFQVFHGLWMYTVHVYAILTYILWLYLFRFTLVYTIIMFYLKDTIDAYFLQGAPIYIYIYIYIVFFLLFIRQGRLFSIHFSLI